MPRPAKLSLLARFKIAWAVLRDPRTPTWAKAFFVAASAIYVVSPLDLIPDWFIGIGWLDDIVMIPFLAWVTTRLAPRIVRRDAARKAEAGGRKAERQGVSMP